MWEQQIFSATHGQRRTASNPSWIDDAKLMTRTYAHIHTTITGAKKERVVRHEIDPFEPRARGLQLGKPAQHAMAPRARWREACTTRRRSSMSSSWLITPLHSVCWSMKSELQQLRNSESMKEKCADDNVNDECVGIRKFDRWINQCPNHQTLSDWNPSARWS